MLQSIAHSPSHQPHTKPNPPAMEGGSPRGVAAAADYLFSGDEPEAQQGWREFLPLRSLVSSTLRWEQKAPGIRDRLRCSAAP